MVESVVVGYLFKKAFNNINGNIILTNLSTMLSLFPKLKW